jgi:facilitated trehalose transporter
MKSLQWLRGKDTDISHELREIENAHNESVKSTSGSSFELFSKSHIKPLLISLGLMFFQQMSGINAVVFYTVMIFEVSKFIFSVLYFNNCFVQM